MLIRAGRVPDVWGNLHVARDHRGLTVFRSPGRYTGRHRRPRRAVWW